MKTIGIKLLTIGLVAGSFAYGSGFKCEGTDSDLNAKLFNRTDSTRVPAVLVVSGKTGTLLTRKNEEISKKNRVNSVQYLVDGNSRIGAHTVILQISFKEGRETLAEGETVDGQLILISEEGKEVYEMSCERYLKNN